MADATAELDKQETLQKDSKTCEEKSDANSNNEIMTENNSQQQQEEKELESKDDTPVESEGVKARTGEIEVVEEKPEETENVTVVPEESEIVTGMPQVEDRFHAAPKDLEIVPKLPQSDDFEIDNTPTKVANKTKVKKKRKSYINTDVPGDVKELWKKPFEIGWGREIVYRNTLIDGRRTGDVYYFSPEGRKLRSMVEIEKYLNDTSSDISISCFTFRKEPVFKEPFEIIRNAKESAGVSKKTSKSSPALGQSPQRSPKVVPKDKKKTKKDSTTPKVKMNFSKTKGNVIKIAHTVLNISDTTGAHQIEDDHDFPHLKSIQSNNSTPEVVRPKRIAVAKKHTGKRKPTVVHANGNEKRQKIGDNHNILGKQKLCDFSCGSSPPTVSCEVCLCLFHPQCIGHPDGKDKFICQGCKTSDEGNIKSGVISVVPAGTTIIGSPTNKGGITVNKGIVSTTRIVSPQNIMSPPGQAQTTSIVVRPSLGGPALTSPVTLLNTVSSSPSTVPPIRLNIPTGSVSPNQVSGQLITLPPHVTNKLNLQKPLNLKLNGQTFNIPPSCFIATADGVKVLLPPGSLPDNVAKGGSSNPIAMSTSSTATSQQLDVHAMGNHVPATTKSPVSKNTSNKVVDLTEENSETNANVEKEKTISSTDSDKLTADKKEKNKAVPKKRTENMCHFRKLHAGFDCMVHIFEHLALPDLLKVQQVCHTWKNVSEQNILWKVLRLRNLQVTDWESAASHIALRRVQVLDLKGLIHPNNDPNRTWHQFHSVLDQLESLKQIEFSGCPSSVLHAVTEKLKNLILCSAESVVESTQENLSNNAKLDLGKFSQLKKLEVLKLRGAHGLALPAFAFSGGLVELGKLQNLKTLALTTLRDVPAREFEFLGSLVNLELLELGDCFLWTDEIYMQLQNLKKLKSLRLEAGGDISNGSLGKALLNLKNLNHLELINFIISEKLGSSLSELKWLETFSVWPNTDAQASKLNHNLLQATKEMTSLKLLEWGVMNESGESSSGIPLLPDPRESGESNEEDVDLLPQTVTSNELIQRLSNHLPDTKIRVFKVPAALIKKVCPAKRAQTPTAPEMDTS